MNSRLLFTILIFLIPSMLFSQRDTGLNITDNEGMKQGHWIKKYQNDTIMYEGFFKDNNPEGEFKRFSSDGTLKSLLFYSNKGSEADAQIYHPNGFLAAKGKYINREKEGMWQFYSEFTNGYIVSEESYSQNKRNGSSVKFYPDDSVAEKMNFKNDTAQGEWTKYYPDGSPSLRSVFINGKLNGKFEAWFDNGKIQFSGEYINDKRDGSWLIYDKDGTLKYKMEYSNGVTNDRQMDIDTSDYLDKLESEKGSIPDPEKTGAI